MNKMTTTIALLIFAFSIVSCDYHQNNVSSGNQTESPQPDATQIPEPNNANEIDINDQPKIGTITGIVIGDIDCNITLKDENGKEQYLNAIFDVCTEPDKFLNQKVNLSYGVETVSDCESAEPCGKSKQAVLINKIEVIDGE